MNVYRSKTRQSSLPAQRKTETQSRPTPRSRVVSVTPQSEQQESQISSVATQKGKLLKYKLHNCLLYQQDNMELMKRMPEKYVNVIVTSPPYNISVPYDDYNDDKSQYAYYSIMKDFAYAAHRVLADNGSLFLNVGSSLKNPTHAFHVLNQFTQIFAVQNVIIWVKSISISPEMCFGHFKPVPGKKYLNNLYEYVFHLTKNPVEIDRLGVGVPYKDKSNIKRRGHKVDLRCRGNVWFIPYETKNASSIHPAEFPERLPSMCLSLVPQSDKSVVMDPFCGAGNTLLAATNMKGVKKVIGCDLSRSYIVEAHGRLRARLHSLRIKH